MEKFFNFGGKDREALIPLESVDPKGKEPLLGKNVHNHQMSHITLGVQRSPKLHS